MKYIKKFLIVIFTMSLAVSCLNSKVQINFDEPTKGTASVELKIYKDIISEEENDKLVKKLLETFKLEKIEVDYKYNGIIKNDQNLLDDKNISYEAYSHLITVKFKNENELKTIFKIFDDSIEVNINRIGNSNVYELEILNSEFIEYTIKVKGQVLTINDETANSKTNEVVFDKEMYRYSLTYEYIKTSFFIIFLIVMLILVIIGFIVFTILNQKYDLKEKLDNLLNKNKKETKDDKEEVEEDIIIEE